MVNGEINSFLMTDPGSSFNYDIYPENFSYQKDIATGRYVPPRVLYRVITIRVQ